MKENSRDKVMKSMFLIDAGDTRRGAPPHATFSEYGGADEWQAPLLSKLKLFFGVQRNF